VERLAQLEKEVRERAQKDQQKEKAESDAPIINPGAIPMIEYNMNGFGGAAPSYFGH